MTYINKKNIPKLDSLKQSENYTYYSTSSTIVVNDSDFKTVVSVYNVTINKMMFILGDESLSGTFRNNELTLNNTFTGVNDNDNLLILYKPVELETIDDLLREIKEELIKLNKVTNKIYR